MDVPCVHCRRVFAAPTALAGQEMACPACGAPNRVPPRRDPTTLDAAPAATPQAHPHGHGHHGGVERIFEPFPKPVLYLFGVVLVLALLAPFWLANIGDRFKDSEVVISQDLEGLPEPVTPTRSSLPSTGPARLPTLDVDLDHYAGIRLGSSREDLQARFGLRLKNTRGMQPEIYEATDVPHADLVTFSFYDNELKEFTLVQPEQRTTPLTIVRELRDRLGEPTGWNDEETPAIAIGGGAASRPQGARDAAELLAARLQRFPYRQQVVWQNAAHRLVATVYYSSKLPVDCLSVLSVHVSAYAWLNNHAAQATVAGEEAGSPMLPSTPPPSAEPPPQRLFP